MLITLRLRAGLVALLSLLTLSAHAAAPLELSVKNNPLGVTLERSPTTGFTRSVRADRQQALPTGTTSTRPEDRARSFLNLNRSVFIDDESPLELVTLPLSWKSLMRVY